MCCRLRRLKQVHEQLSATQTMSIVEHALPVDESRQRPFFAGDPVGLLQELLKKVIVLQIRSFKLAHFCIG